ncbi:hypothetical protein PV325_003658 [Microctonus aethiopoides]|nr:hypothetical protein PV325_003658 [Microctonus aethiopoides]
MYMIGGVTRGGGPHSDCGGLELKSASDVERSNGLESYILAHKSVSLDLAKLDLLLAKEIRGGGVAGGGGGGTAAGRGLELEHPPTMSGAPAGFHWGAMIAGHHAAAAAGMMQPPLSAGADYSLAGAHGGGHPAMPMDLHVSQGFPCYSWLSLLRLT